MGKSLFLTLVLLFVLGRVGAQTPQVDCEVLLRLPALRLEGFNTVETTEQPEMNSWGSDLTLFIGEEGLHVYQGLGRGKFNYE